MAVLCVDIRNICRVVLSYHSLLLQLIPFTLEHIQGLMHLHPHKEVPHKIINHLRLCCKDRSLQLCGRSLRRERAIIQTHCCRITRYEVK